MRIYPRTAIKGAYGQLMHTKPDDPICISPFEEMAIYWNGEVALCSHDWDRESDVSRFGNLSDNDATITDIWNGSLFRSFRIAHNNPDFDTGVFVGPCSNCHFRNIKY